MLPEISFQGEPAASEPAQSIQFELDEPPWQRPGRESWSSPAGLVPERQNRRERREREHMGRGQLAIKGRSTGVTGAALPSLQCASDTHGDEWLLGSASSRGGQEPSCDSRRSPAATGSRS